MNKMAILSPFLSVFKYKWIKVTNQKTEWLHEFNKQRSGSISIRDSTFRLKDTERLKVKDWKKIFHANGNFLKESKSGHPYTRQNRL